MGVIPAKARIHSAYRFTTVLWVPAFAGMISSYGLWNPVARGERLAYEGH